MAKRLKKGSTELLEVMEKMMLEMAKDPSQASPLKLNILDKGMKLVLVKEKVSSGFGGMFDEEEGASGEDPADILGEPLLRNSLDEEEELFGEEEDGSESPGRTGEGAGAKVG